MRSTGLQNKRVKNAVSGVGYAFCVEAKSTGLNEKTRKHWRVAGLSFFLKNVLLKILGGEREGERERFEPSILLTC